MQVNLSKVEYNFVLPPRKKGVTPFFREEEEEKRSLFGEVFLFSGALTHGKTSWLTVDYQGVDDD
jgi:hypothetical protein